MMTNSQNTLPSNFNLIHTLCKLLLIKIMDLFRCLNTISGSRYTHIRIFCRLETYKCLSRGLNTSFVSFHVQQRRVITPIMTPSGRVLPWKPGIHCGPGKTPLTAARYYRFLAVVFFKSRFELRMGKLFKLFTSQKIKLVCYTFRE